MFNINDGIQDYLKEYINCIDYIKILILENTKQQHWSNDNVLWKIIFEKKKLTQEQKKTLFNTDFAYLFYDNWIKFYDSDSTSTSSNVSNANTNIGDVSNNEIQQTLEQFILKNGILEKEFMGFRKIIQHNETYLEIYLEETLEEKIKRIEELNEALNTVSNISVNINPKYYQECSQTDIN